MIAVDTTLPRISSKQVKASVDLQYAKRETSRYDCFSCLPSLQSPDHFQRKKNEYEISDDIHYLEHAPEGDLEALSYVEGRRADASITLFIHFFPTNSEVLGTWHWNAITKTAVTVHAVTNTPIARLHLLCTTLGERDRIRAIIDNFAQHKVHA